MTSSRRRMIVGRCGTCRQYLEVVGHGLSSLGRCPHRHYFVTRRSTGCRLYKPGVAEVST